MLLNEKITKINEKETDIGPFFRKILWMTFWATFVENLATFYSNIWSRWKLTRLFWLERGNLKDETLNFTKKFTRWQKNFGLIWAWNTNFEFFGSASFRPNGQKISFVKYHSSNLKVWPDGYITCNVTRFCEISPLVQNFTILSAIFGMVYLVFYKRLYLHWQLIMLLVNFSLL